VAYDQPWSNGMSISDVVRVAVLCVIYFATAKFGLSLDAVSGFAAAVWPPTGVALAALVLYGYRLWPGIALGAFLVNLSAGAPVLVAGGMALGNTLEALVGTVLLERVVGFRPSLDRLQDVLGLIALAAGFSTLVSATIGVTSGWLGGVIPAATYGDAWRTWWLGDALGDLVVAPLLFVWSRRGRIALSWNWIAEALILLVAVGGLSLVVFDVPTPALSLSRYLIFVVLILVVLRLGPHGVVTALALRSAIAIWGTAQSFDPFAGPTLHESLFFLQTFMSLVAVTFLILAAAMTERRQAEAAAREQRERFEVTLFSIGDAVIATDRQGRVTFMNPVAEAVTGWPEAEAVGQDITEVFRIVNEYTRQVVENPIAQVIRLGTVVGLANHTLLIARDGVERPIDDSGAPIRDSQGRLIGIVLVFRDITERRRVEEARTRLAAIVESSEDAIIGKTLEGIITSWNQGAERIYGYTAEEVIGRSLVFLMPPDHPDELPTLLARLARGEIITHYETTRLRKDGQVIPVALTISPIRNPAGTIVGASTIARDITARKQAEAEVERRRRETELLAEFAQNLSASLDFDTVLQRVVAGAQELCGSERAFITLREPGSDILVGCYEVGVPDRTYAGRRIESGKGLGGQVLRTGRPWRTADYAVDARFSKEYVAVTRAQGHLAVIAVPILMGARVEGVLYASNPSARPFTDQDEAILVRLATHAAIAIQNAQLYRQTQTELVERRQAEERLTASLQEKEVLLKEIHHRVKNNLQIISSLLSLQSEAIADPDLLTQFQDSQDRVRSMALVHETLYQSQDLARLNMAPYIHTLSAQLLQSYSVDPSRLDVRIQADRLLLNLDQAIPCGLILNELLTNAFKYAFPLGQAGVVHVALYSVTAQQARLVVRDTGVGFPADLDFRHTATLGLQLVVMLTEQLGGTITLERDGGTIFTLTFPMLAPEV
jgi:PAS domain S-box-containing protein